jgi:class 3 adenylate cyclase
MMRTTVATEPGCIVFTDLVGFTELTAELGDDFALSALERQAQVAEMVLPPCGRVVKELGDGMLLWFDDACEAIDAVLRLRGALEHPAGTQGEPLWLRIGVHWGSPSRRGDDLVGHHVNLAHRIVDLASPGEVLASEPVVDRLEDRFELDELGPVVVRGVPDPVRLFRVLPA